MTAPELPIQDVSGEDRLRVTGAPHYQDELAAASGPKRSGGVEDRRPFALVPEPDNPHDPHAVAVLLASGEPVGYVPRDIAPRVGEGWSAVVLRERRATPRDPRTGLTMLLARADAIELRVT
jgi:hypothetical protein